MEMWRKKTLQPHKSTKFCYKILILFLSDISIWKEVHLLFEFGMMAYHLWVNVDNVGESRDSRGSNPVQTKFVSIKNGGLLTAGIPDSCKAHLRHWENSETETWT